MKIELPELTEFEKGLYDEWVGSNRNHTHKPLDFSEYNNKTTVCVLKLSNGFEIVGTSGCEDPLKFDQLLGRTYALKDALRKLGEFAAFYRAQKTHDIKNAEPLKSRELSPFEVEELRRLIALGNSAPVKIMTVEEGYMTTGVGKLDIKA